MHKDKDLIMFWSSWQVAYDSQLSPNSNHLILWGDLADGPPLSIRNPSQRSAFQEDGPVSAASEWNRSGQGYM